MLPVLVPLNSAPFLVRTTLSLVVRVSRETLIARFGEPPPHFLHQKDSAAVGKHKRLIIGAVMRKLRVMAYGIRRSGKRFDANYA